jgi:hypothetical protein
MPADLVEKPFLLDFAHNAANFTLSGTPTSVIGRKAITRYKINRLPRTSYFLTLRYGTKTYNFLMKSTSTVLTNSLEIHYHTLSGLIKSELEKKIAQNYYISRDFDVQVSNSLEITFTAKQYGGNTVTLQTNDTNANIQLLNQTTGIEREERSGYRIFAKLEIIRTLYGGLQTTETPEILLYLNTSNRAVLPLTLLRSYFSGADIPAPNEKFAVYPLKYLLLKYRLMYSDYFDDFMQVMKCSEWYYLVNGKLSESHRALNLPDWICPMAGSNKLSAFVRPRSYGSLSGLTVKSYPALPQYACFMLFNNSGTETYKSSLQIRVDILNEDGSTVLGINPGTITLSNFSMVRIPLSVKALSLDNHSTQILRYMVRIYHTDTPTAVWTRTYVMQQKPFHAKEFLLQNQYGFLESFFIDHEMVEKAIEGEEVICNGKTEIDINDVSTTYTARTGYKSNTEMRLLAEAIENSCHYKIVNNSLVPITILPDTLTVIDEMEDLQTAEFQYVFKFGNTLGETEIGTTFRRYIWVDEEIWDDASKFITG